LIGLSKKKIAFIALFVNQTVKSIEFVLLKAMKIGTKMSEKPIELFWKNCL
jgi:hypothetical protein